MLESADELTMRQNYNVKNEMSQKYKFVLAFENANLTDWVTEKVWHAFHAGAVPGMLVV